MKSHVLCWNSAVLTTCLPPWSEVAGSTSEVTQCAAEPFLPTAELTRGLEGGDAAGRATSPCWKADEAASDVLDQSQPAGTGSALEGPVGPRGFPMPSLSISDQL